MLTKVDIAAFLQESSDPEAIREGKEHVQLGRVEISKLTGNLIGGVVGGTWIQIHFAPNKVHITKDCSCYSRKCNHITGLLFKLIQSKQNTFANKAGYWRKVIEEMPHDAKDRFILDLVKRNKAIAYDLRANILRQEGLYSVEIGKAIFDELKSPIVRSTRSPTSAQVRVFSQVSKTTLNSIQHLLGQGYNYQGLAITMHLLENLHYLYFRLKRNNNSIFKHIISVEKTLVDHFSLLRAPEAQYDILRHWKELTSKSYYIPFSKEHHTNFFQSLPSKEVKQTIFNHIENRIKSTTGFTHGLWCQNWIDIAIQEKEVSINLSINDISEYKLDAIWSTLIKQSIPSNLEDFFHQLLSQLPEKNLKEALAYLIQEERVGKILNILSKHDKLQYNNGGKKISKILFKSMKKSDQYTIEQISEVLANTHENKWIKTFIKKENNLIATIPLLRSISKEEIMVLSGIIMDQVKDFLTTHIGIQSEKNMERLFDILDIKGNRKLKSSVRQVLKESFGYRNDIHNVLYSK